MRRVLSTHGGVIPASTLNQFFQLPVQGNQFKLDRVFFEFANDISEGTEWYFRLQHLNGAGEVIAETASTAAEIGGDSGSMHFFAEVEFRSHFNSNMSQLMTAPMGCEGFEVATNDTVRILFSASISPGLSFDLTVGTIFWHCVFDDVKK